MRAIELNSLQLNAVRLNGIGGYQRDSHAGAPPVVPDVPDTPVEPEPTTYTLVAEVANGVVSAKLNGVAIQLPYTATEGDVIVLEITPAEGYKFASWIDGNTENPRTITMLSNVTLSASCEVATPSNPDVDENGYIIFEDAEVARICAETWGDGKGITLEQAAAVTSVGSIFNSNATITSFNELRFFKNVKNIGSIRAFAYCSSLKSIDLSNVTSFGSNTFLDCTALETVNTQGQHWLSVGSGVFGGCSSLKGDYILSNLEGNLSGLFKGTAVRSVVAPVVSQVSIIRGFENCSKLEYLLIGQNCSVIGTVGVFNGCVAMQALIITATTPPSLYRDDTLNAPTNFPVYVPDASVAAYRETSVWSSYASRIFPISQLQADNSDLYAEIEEYL